jgi:hypothetical protein
MASRTFNIPKTKGTAKTTDATDVAARYFVYKLYEATDGRPMEWQVLRGMGELRETVLRAVERGWVILQGAGGKPLERSAALTDEGRRLARRGRYAGKSSRFATALAHSWPCIWRRSIARPESRA